MQHYSYCGTFYSSPCDCPLAGVQKSDEALDALRRKLTGSEPEYPVALTIYTQYGTQTLHNINESSIRFAEGRLTCEAQDGSSKCPIYTFGSVQGYSTTFA